MKMRIETGGQRVWSVQSSTAKNITEIGDHLQFWFVNDPVLNSTFIHSIRPSIIIVNVYHSDDDDDDGVGVVADEISFFGNVGIIGLYMTIVVTLGSVIRNFLLPQVTTLM